MLAPELLERKTRVDLDPNPHLRSDPGDAKGRSQRVYPDASVSQSRLGGSIFEFRLIKLYRLFRFYGQPAAVLAFGRQPP